MNSNIHNHSENLTEDTMNRIRSLVTSPLSEVKTKTIEEYVSSYAGQSAEYIERDLRINEQLMQTYQTIITKYPEFQIGQKIDAYKMLLLLTMGMSDFSTVKNLTEEQMGEINQIFEQTVLKAIQR